MFKVILNIIFVINNLLSLMVKLALKGAQDPADPSLQMKVYLLISYR